MADAVQRTDYLKADRTLVESSYNTAGFGNCSDSPRPLLNSKTLSPVGAPCQD